MAYAPDAMLNGFENGVAQTPEQNPLRVADAIVGLLAWPRSRRRFRTTVDVLGMGDAMADDHGRLEAIMAIPTETSARRRCCESGGTLPKPKSVVVNVHVIDNTDRAECVVEIREGKTILSRTTSIIAVER